MLIYPTPVPDPNSAHLLRLSHHSLLIEADFELVQEVRCEYYTNSNGARGVPLLNTFEASDTLTALQKARLTEQWKPFIRRATTRGSMIDPTTGELVEPDETGQYPKGSVPERLRWLSALAADVPGDKLSEKVQALIMSSMQIMVENERL